MRKMKPVRTSVRAPHLRSAPLPVLALQGRILLPPRSRPWAQARAGLAGPRAGDAPGSFPVTMGAEHPEHCFPRSFSLSFADNNITVFPALAVGWEEPAALGGIDPIDPRGSMSFPGDLLKKLLMSLFHFHQLITSCCCSLHFSSTCRNESCSPSPILLQGLSLGCAGRAQRCGRVTPQGRSRRSLCAGTHRHSPFSSPFLKGSPAAD